MFKALLFDYKRQRLWLGKGSKIQIIFGVLILIVGLAMLYLFSQPFSWRLYISAFVFLGLSICFCVNMKRHVVPGRKDEDGKEKQIKEAVVETEEASKAEAFGRESIEAKQIKYFKKCVNEVENLINKTDSGNNKGKCIDLLLEECKNFLLQPKNSELVKKKCKPIVSFLGIAASIVFIGFMQNEGVIENKSFTVEGMKDAALDGAIAFFAQLIQGAGDLVMVIVVISLFVFLYLTVVFVVVPDILIPVIDRDWIVAQEIREILEFIKVRENGNNEDSEDTYLACNESV